MTKDSALAAHWAGLAAQFQCPITHCSSFATAQFAMRRTLPEIVIIDLDTTQVEGWSFIRSLRGPEDEIEFPWIIGLQREVGVDEVDAAMGAGINEIVDKKTGLEGYKNALLEANSVHRENRLLNAS
jgi:DNA-binding NarL/FixJ family response regulator